ncbi:hypothetical protein [Streptomyces xanthophaeus]
MRLWPPEGRRLLDIGVRLRRSREVAGVGLGEDAEFDQAVQLGAGAFDVLRQQFVAEGFADVDRGAGEGGYLDPDEAESAGSFLR